MLLLDLGLSDSMNIPGINTGTALFFLDLSPSCHGAIINTTPWRTWPRISLDLWPKCSGVHHVGLSENNTSLVNLKGLSVFIASNGNLGYTSFQNKTKWPVTTSCSKLCSTQLKTVNHFLEPVEFVWKQGAPWWHGPTNFNKIIQTYVPNQKTALICGGKFLYNC